MFRIPLTKPYLPPGTKESVCSVLDSGYLTEGPLTAELEKAVSEYIGSKHAIALTSCTVGLELALRALGIGNGDEVIVPDFTYPATADAVKLAGAEPVIVDVDKNSMLIDYAEIEKAISPATKAVMPVSEFGNPLDYDKLNEIKNRHGIFIVEDAACAIGSEYKGKKTGTLADISVFSMHPRKTLTSGEGGIITTDNGEWADFIRSYKHFGMKCEDSKLYPKFVQTGSNYKISDILSATALPQMKILGEIIGRRRSLARRYIEAFEKVSSIGLPQVSPGGNHSYQTFCIFVEKRDSIMKKMREDGIEVQIGTYCLHRQKAFECNRDFPESDYAFSHALALPLYYEMSEKDQNEIVEKIINLSNRGT